MSKYLFKVPCPVCGSGSPRVWYHNSEKCGGEWYIDEDIYLNCNKCNDKTYIFNLPFKCEEHDDFRKPNPIILVKLIALLVKISNMPVDIAQKMVNKTPPLNK